MDVVTRAGITDSLAPRVLRTLEGLDLIDGQGNPTPALEGLRRAATADFKERLAEVVRAAYAEVLQFTDPATDDVTRVADAFRVYEPVGQRKRMVTLFLGLCEAAGIVPEGKSKSAPKESPRRSKGAAKQGSKSSSAASSKPSFRAGGIHVRNDQNGTIPPAISGLLASLPSEGEGWTRDQRDKWLEVFQAVLNFSYPLITLASMLGTDHEDTDDE